MRNALHHKQTDQILLRVNPKAGAGSATPIVFACRADFAYISGVEHHAKIQTKTDALAAKGNPQVGQMIGGHKSNGFR